MRLAISVVLALLLPGVAGAASKPESEQKLEARRSAEAAGVAYTLGRFDDALAKYERAYELFQAPALLFNIGQCHRQLARHQRAIYFFTVFLRENPKAPNRAQVEELLEEERRLLARESSEKPQPPVAVQPVTAPATMAASLPLTQPTPAVVVTAPITTRWWFWVAIAGGAVIVAGAVTAGVILAQPEVLPSGSVGVLDRRQ